ncbi:predicted protein [Nematostella vectensis]|uniref:Uncharacterized protein n=1 Tax=Nematostella vectensis TaxID=45351 RepID=A7RFB7_NEMVE|nr:predicted protein [Nematostella vectensis]|eukprot:XP_001641991.1 predicted protein [Nematostella vectensis]
MALAIGGGVLVLILAVVLRFCYWRKKNGKVQPVSYTNQEDKHGVEMLGTNVTPPLEQHVTPSM